MRPGVDAGLRHHHGLTRWVRPDKPLFDSSSHEVAVCPERDARYLVETHHYSHSWPSALRCYALYRGPFIVGAVCLSYPMNDAVLTNPFPDLVPADESAELGRVVLLPGAAFNAASWMLSRVFELEKKRGTLGIVAFSDPVKRTTLDGKVVLPGHTGITYQALRAAKVGRSKPRKLLLFPNATAIADRSFQKINGREQGWQGVVKRIVKAGYPEPADDIAAWTKAVQSTLRPLQHGGNHRYLFALDPIVGIPHVSESYPREIDSFQETLL